MPELEQMFTVADVANMTSMSDRTIRNYLRSGLLRGRKIGGQWRFTMDDIKCFLAQGEIGAALTEQQRADIMDFIDGVNTRVTGERQTCMIVDLYIPNETAADYNDRLCELFAKTENGNVVYYYNYHDAEERARFIFFAEPAFAAKILEILK